MSENNVIPPEDDGVLDAQDTLESDDLEYDPLDAGIAPPEHWSPAEFFGNTAEEARRGESLDQLLAEEEPDIDPDAPEEDDEDDELKGLDNELEVLDEGLEDM
ncbi:hypothetical protein [Streptomyces enissocaesilis]|uniref:Uncharacterized protein n=1 Tax=Streptomyces enissocaesilis TaxID=332589 RepID=A0ABN3XCT6_9ACTN